MRIVADAKVGAVGLLLSLLPWLMVAAIQVLKPG
jgi:hypothetical protein